MPGSRSASPSTAPPNRVRDTTPVTNGALGTLSIRRRFTNHTGAPVTTLRFRIVNVTTLNSPSVCGGCPQADLRALSSPDVSVTVGGMPVTVRGTTLEQESAQTLGGGLNSSLAVGAIDLAQPLAAGSSVEVQFLLGVQQGGQFSFFVNVEALPNPAGMRPLKGSRTNKLAH